MANDLINKDCQYLWLKIILQLYRQDLCTRFKCECKSAIYAMLKLEWQINKVYLWDTAAAVHCSCAAFLVSIGHWYFLCLYSIYQLGFFVLLEHDVNGKFVISADWLWAAVDGQKGVCIWHWKEMKLISN